MNERLQQIIRYKTGGSQKEFAEKLGWSAPYLAKILKVGFGISPVAAILQRFPEIDARWFILGEGTMLTSGKRADLLREAHEQAMAVLDIEKYIEIMSPEELAGYEHAILNKKPVEFSPETIQRWERVKQDKDAEKTERIEEAMNKAKKYKKAKEDAK